MSEDTKDIVEAAADKVEAIEASVVEAVRSEEHTSELQSH